MLRLWYVRPILLRRSQYLSHTISNLIWERESIVFHNMIMIVTRPRVISVDNFCSFAWFEESPPSIWLKVTRKPGCIGLFRDSRVRDWLWLGNILVPLAHPTWGKLLRDLMRFKRFWKLSCQSLIKKKEEKFSLIRRFLSYRIKKT